MKTRALTPGRRLGQLVGQVVSSAGLWSGGYFLRAPADSDRKAAPPRRALPAACLGCRVRSFPRSAQSAAGVERGCWTEPH
jgi:hypothetical protein